MRNRSPSTSNEAGASSSATSPGDRSSKASSSHAPTSEEGSVSCPESSPVSASRPSAPCSLRGSTSSTARRKGPSSSASMTQLPLALAQPPAYGREDFLVADSNRDALRWVDAWPGWPGRGAGLVRRAGAAAKPTSPMSGGSRRAAPCWMRGGSTPGAVGRSHLVIEAVDEGGRRCGAAPCAQPGEGCRLGHPCHRAHPRPGAGAAACRIWSRGCGQPPPSRSAGPMMR